MQLEKMIPHTEGNYERRVFCGEDDAIAWMKVCHFEIDVGNFLEDVIK
jgi:hypothetical protein